MEGIRERLRAIREFMGWSSRRLSLELGLSASAWAGYESGDALPGASTLLALSHRNIDLNWLFSGVGKMILEPIPQDLPSFERNLERQESSHLGLGRISLVARRSNRKLRMGLLDTLVSRFPCAFSLEELQDTLSQPQEDIAAAVAELLDEDQIHVVAGIPERYQAPRLSAVTIASTLSDQSELGITAIKFIVADVLPKVHLPNSTAVLIEAVAHVEDGKILVNELLDLLKSKSAEHHSDKGDVVRLVLAADISGRGTNTADRKPHDNGE